MVKGKRGRPMVHLRPEGVFTGDIRQCNKCGVEINARSMRNHLRRCKSKIDIRPESVVTYSSSKIIENENHISSSEIIVNTKDISEDIPSKNQNNCLSNNVVKYNHRQQNDSHFEDKGGLTMEMVIMPINGDNITQPCVKEENIQSNASLGIEQSRVPNKRLTNPKTIKSLGYRKSGRTASQETYNKVFKQPFKSNYNGTTNNQTQNFQTKLLAIEKCHLKQRQLSHPSTPNQNHLPQ